MPQFQEPFRVIFKHATRVATKLYANKLCII